ncbi:MAG: dethiobiotin synthase [Actinomycetota bacterium]|nr:dethiobiotin synthase [Actinomycetota bacterium]
MAEPRPEVLVVVAGTGTEVGKTWVACALAGALRRRGVVVAARKPAQSFEGEAPAEPTDAERLAAATGETVADVCPSWRWYGKAMAPPMAAESLGLPVFSLRELLGELRWPAGTRVGLVEEAGGVGSPQAGDGDGVDMVDLLRPDLVVLVARPGLGTLSDISLASRALATQHVLVYLNRFDPADELHVANRRWLCERLGLAVVTSPAELAGGVERLAGYGPAL